ncbi:MAG: DEAD/DEAH box helicase [Candidatus Sumerlaeaceae bacterium]|nr:DEAD/DEAH box helicase [Candidatus Sumerlaeaceae bacterium]
MSAEIQLLDDGYFALSFAYDAARVARVRSLKNRRWNKSEKRWEVGINHLGEVMKIFNLAPEKLDSKLLRKYKVHQIKHYRARLMVGNVETTIIGTGLPVKQIDAATCFYLPGYQFMPRYIEGRWDGKRHLYDPRKSTIPSGLVSRVREILDKEGVEYDIGEPTREESWKPLGAKKPRFTLRDYQEDCVKAALENKRGVIELATGSGKTAVATWLIHTLDRPAVFFVHTRDLLHQTRDYMEDQLGLTVGQVGDGKVDIRPVTVATVQTCAKALGIKVVKSDEDETLEDDKTDISSAKEDLIQHLREVPLVFFDECHHLPADTCYSLAMATEGAGHRFGLSATPYRSDRMDLLLEAALGAKIFRANASVLIERKYLVPPVITVHAAPIVKFSGKTPDYASVYQQCIVENGPRHRMIAQHARDLVKKGKSVLILVSQVRHGEAIQRELSEAVLVQGSDDAAKRRTVFKALENKTKLAVIATTLADEGLDIPSLDAVILASGGKSETRALQRLGRALRTSPGKRTATVIDYFDMAQYLKEHALRRIEIYESEPAFKVQTVGFKV